MKSYSDSERLDALLYNFRLDLRNLREDGKWVAADLETEKVIGVWDTAREAIDGFLDALATPKSEKPNLLTQLCRGCLRHVPVEEWFDEGGCCVRCGTAEKPHPTTAMPGEICKHFAPVGKCGSCAMPGVPHEKGCQNAKDTEAGS